MISDYTFKYIFIKPLVEYRFFKGNKTFNANKILIYNKILSWPLSGRGITKWEEPVMVMGGASVCVDFTFV